MPELGKLFTTIGFLGAGNMASAIIKSIVSGKRQIAPSNVYVFDIDTNKSQKLQDALDVRATADHEALLARADSIVLATKPQDLLALLASISEYVDPKRHRFISIAAGTKLKQIEAALPRGTRVIRVMPNTPAMVGEGAAGVAGGREASADDLEAVVTLFKAVGFAAQVHEGELDAVTALSGSGPAYIFRIMELMEQAGEEMGLAPELARDLTLQTVLGAAVLAKDSADSLSTLRQKVTSPGGTTAAALESFEQNGLSKTIIEGMKRAQARSIELGQD